MIGLEFVFDNGFWNCSTMIRIMIRIIMIRIIILMMTRVNQTTISVLNKSLDQENQSSPPNTNNVGRATLIPLDSIGEKAMMSMSDIKDRPTSRFMGRIGLVHKCLFDNEYSRCVGSTNHFMG